MSEACISCKEFGRGRTLVLHDRGATHARRALDIGIALDVAVPPGLYSTRTDDREARNGIGVRLGSENLLPLLVTVWVISCRAHYLLTGLTSRSRSIFGSGVPCAASPFITISRNSVQPRCPQCLDCESARYKLNKRLGRDSDFLRTDRGSARRDTMTRVLPLALTAKQNREASSGRRDLAYLLRNGKRHKGPSPHHEPERP
ncbi:hypothetical protein NM688_g8597 [Phlebia brevispora]|uniref:Uncharacterized protein n=1 Tax=Phlebia brevispora TaxID=194682 RepID=A0ACC1RTY1_9APHY|nr:hypothetical protein NM688_g8597 [Phlebia brevispora]